VILDIYGLVIEVNCNPGNLLEEAIRPFKFFLSEGKSPEININIEQKDPPYNSFPAIKASFSTPRNIVFKSDIQKIIDYFGNGVVIEDKTESKYNIVGCEANFLYEAFYLLIISLFGQFCDRQGFLRVHALALSYKDTAILLPIPPGGGKSTLAMAMLNTNGFKLISDDEPIVDSSGYIHPFPTRIGTLDKKKIESIPSKFVYQIDRMEFGKKFFIDYDYWQDRIEDKPLKKSVLFISHRLLNGEPSIQKASRTKALSSLIRDAVIGVGLYQGLEFILHNSSWEILSKIRVVSSRFIKAVKLASSAKTYQIYLSRNIEKNALVLKEFLESTL
jgi:hypothetical protein